MDNNYFLEEISTDMNDLIYCYLKEGKWAPL